MRPGGKGMGHTREREAVCIREREGCARGRLTGLWADHTLHTL